MANRGARGCLAHDGNAGCAVTAAELVDDATRRICERTGADPAVVRDCLAHTAQVLLCEGLTVANDVRCDSLRRCNRCEDCRLADVIERDEDGPDYAYERAHSAASLG